MIRLGVLGSTNGTDLQAILDAVSAGELDAATLDISGNADIDGTTNLDAVDIDGAVQIDGTVTVGVDDTGLDVKLFGASAGAYMEWDESIDTLRIVGASADATTSTGKLLLATSLTDINASDVIGKIDFQAPLESGGTDAITVAASIQAMAQGTFSASVNATDLLFFTGHSEAATEKFRFTSQGEIGVGGANYGTDGQVLTSGGAGAAPAWEDTGAGAVTAVNNATANELVTIGATTTELEAEANLTFDGTDVLVGGAGKLQLRDTGLYINSSTDGQLDLIADTEIQIAATTIDINGAVALNGAITGATNITLSGELDAATLDISGNADIDGTLEADAITINSTAIGSIYGVIAGSSSIVTTGALDSGSITSGFGTIDTGSSTITTTGLISGGSLDIDNVLINGTTIGHTDDTDLLTVADGALTVAGTIGSGAITSSGIVTGTAFTAGSAVLAESELELLDGLTAGTAIASKVVTTDASIDTTGQRNLTISGELDAATLDISGNADIDGTANLDTVDIDGAVQIDAAFTSGVDGQGYDTKFFGDTSSAYMLWDTSADDLVFAGAAGIDLAGDIDVDGTANLDVVDIDGAVDMASTLAVAGVSSFAVAANVAQVAITSSSNAVAWDASAAANAYHITTENTTLSAPSNAVEGAFICIEINFNGSHTFAWNAIFNFAADTAPTTTDTDAKTDIFVFRYNGAIWQEVGRTLNIPES